MSVVFFSTPEVYSQEKKKETKYERKNKRKNRINRRQERRGEVAKSNRRQRRQLRWKMRSRQGDKPFRGDISGRRITPNRPSRRSTANYAQPDPYAGRKRTSEASRAKATSKRFYPPVSATRRGERAFDKTISGRKIKPNKSSRQRQVYQRVNPYKYRDRQTETDKARRAAKRQTFPISGTRKGERTPVPQTSPYLGKKRLSESDRAQRAAKRQTFPISGTRKGERTPVPQTSPYLGKKRLSESDRARRAAKRQTFPISGTRRGERGRVKTAKGERPNVRSITGSFKRGNTARINPYVGRKRRTDADRVSRLARKFSPPSSASRPLESAFSRSRTQPRSATGFNKGGKPSVSPYLGQKRETESDRARRAAKNIVRPQSATRPSERNRKRIAISPRSATGLNRTPQKAISPYLGPRRASPQERAQRIRRKFTPPQSSGIGGNLPRTKKKVTPRTGTQAFIRRRKNPYSGRKMDKWEDAHEGDITGRKLKTKVSVMPPPRKPTFKPYQGRGKLGDKPYEGRFSIVGARRATKPTESVYTGKHLGKRNTSITKPSEANPGKPIQGQRQMSISGKYKGSPKTVFDPYYGRGKLGDKAYSGQLTKRRAMSVTKPGESKPGKPLQGERTLSISPSFKGNPKTVFDPYYRRGKLGDKPYDGIIPRTNYSTITRPAERGQKRQAFTGTKSLSMSGKYKGAANVDQAPGYRSITTLWNNKGKPLPKRGLTDNALGQTLFQGNNKARKPDKGGGSVTTQWNNKGKPLPRDIPSKNAFTQSGFQGNIKTKKPEKGGGSVTTQWNNDGNPLPRDLPSKNAISQSQFQGNLKTVKPEKGGGSITTQWNNEGQPIKRKAISPQIYKATRFAGNMKAVKPAKGAGGTVARGSWNNEGIPLKKQAISPQIYQAARFRGSFKQNTMFPSANDQHVNYSGEMKVSRNRGKNFHPSFYFAKDNNKRGIDEKKFDIKKIWVNLFKTNQPVHLRNKPQKLRFDPGEEGMWHD